MIFFLSEIVNNNEAKKEGFMYKILIFRYFFSLSLFIYEWNKFIHPSNQSLHSIKNQEMTEYKLKCRNIQQVPVPIVQQIQHHVVHDEEDDDDEDGDDDDNE